MRWLLLACALLSPSLATAETWGLGLRASSFARGEEGAGDPLVFRGGGAMLRFRPFAHWSFEGSFDALRAKAESGAISASSVPFLLTARFHLITRQQWDFYFLFGAGGAETKVTFQTADGSSREESFKEAVVHLGAGLEFRLGRFGIGAELAAVGVGTDEKPETFVGPPGEDAGGIQLSVTCAFYL